MLIRAMIALLALFGTAAWAGPLDGVYKGIVGAQGMRLQIAQEEDKYRGLFADRSGGSHVFEADPIEAGAEGVLEYGGRKLFARFNLDGPGLRMVTIPIDAEGVLLMANAQALIFVRDELDLPPRPRRYVEPPQGPGGTIDPEAYVESYAFWPADAVSYGYGMVRGRYRTLIRLHALVQADILWKMCQSQATPAGLAEALRGQGVDCNDVLTNMGRLLRGGDAFNRFKADVAAQKKALTTAIRCSIDYRRKEPECLASGRQVAEAAVSLDTVKGALARY